MFNFLTTCQAVFQSKCTILHFHQQCMRAPSSPHPRQHLQLLVFLIAALRSTYCPSSKDLLRGQLFYDPLLSPWLLSLDSLPPYDSMKWDLYKTPVMPREGLLLGPESEPSGSMWFEWRLVKVQAKPALQKLLSQVKASIRTVPLGQGAGPELTQGSIDL